MTQSGAGPEQPQTFALASVLYPSHTHPLLSLLASLDRAGRDQVIGELLCSLIARCRIVPAALWLPAFCLELFQHPKEFSRRPSLVVESSRTAQEWFLSCRASHGVRIWRSSLPSFGTWL